MSVLSDFSRLNLSTNNKLKEIDNETLDPRIQIELDSLNKASADINQLENELDVAKSIFNNSKNCHIQRLECQQKSFGNSISKAKPFFEALQNAQRLQIETEKAAKEFQKANSLYKTAKETLAVAENNLCSGVLPDVWQEHISETITKIYNSKKLADATEKLFKEKSAEYKKVENLIQEFEKKLKKHIIKSQIYYQEKLRWTVQLESQKKHIDEIENEINEAKFNYKQAMINLSKISEEIHLKRKLEKEEFIIPFTQKDPEQRIDGLNSNNNNFKETNRNLIYK